MFATQRENRAAREDDASRGRVRGGESGGRVGATFSFNFLKMEEGGVWPWRIPLWHRKKVVDFAKVSQEDWEELGKYKWFKNMQGYCSTKKTSTGQRLMHRMVVVLQNQTLHRLILIDHINGDKLDNRRENLRTATAAQNAANKSKAKGNLSSQYIGVSFNRKKGKYVAKLQLNGKNFNLGNYNTEKQAALARDLFLVHQDDVDSFRHKLNFPDLIDHLKQQPPLKLRTRKPNTVRNFQVKTEYEDVNANTIRVLIKSKPDAIVWIDRDDYDRIKYFSLYIYKNYVRFADHMLKQHRLHRFLMNNNDPNIYIDHIDGNTLNNCKSNLRNVTVSENAQNRKKSKNANSVFHGVCKTNKQKFQALVSQGDFVYRKNHTNERFAARDRDLVIMKLFPESKYKLNFVWTADEIDEWSFFLLNKYYV